MSQPPLWHTGGQFNFRSLLASAAPASQTLGQQGYAMPTTGQGERDPAAPAEMTAEQRAAAALRGQQARDFLKSGWGTLVKVAAPLAGFAIGGPPAAIAANTLVGLASAETPAQAGLAGLGGIAGLAGGNLAHAASAVTTGLLGAANLAGQPLASNPYENLAAAMLPAIGQAYAAQSLLKQKQQAEDRLQEQQSRRAQWAATPREQFKPVQSTGLLASAMAQAPQQQAMQQLALQQKLKEVR